jgi:uncharacterized membrane protein YjjP (DUF1212 family)
MDCNIKPKNQSQNKVLEFVMTATAYALFESGTEPEKVKKILQDLNEVADSMCANYVAFCDIRKVLKEEYNFTLNFN